MHCSMHFMDINSGTTPHHCMLDDFQQPVCISEGFFWNCLKLLCFVWEHFKNDWHELVYKYPSFFALQMGYFRDVSFILFPEFPGRIKLQSSTMVAGWIIHSLLTVFSFQYSFLTLAQESLSWGLLLGKSKLRQHLTSTLWVRYDHYIYLCRQGNWNMQMQRKRQKWRSNPRCESGLRARILATPNKCYRN